MTYNIYIDKFHSKLVYVGLTQACPNCQDCLTLTAQLCGPGLGSHFLAVFFFWKCATTPDVHLCHDTWRVLPGRLLALLLQYQTLRREGLDMRLLMYTKKISYLEGPSTIMHIYAGQIVYICWTFDRSLNGITKCRPNGCTLYILFLSLSITHSLTFTH